MLFRFPARVIDYFLQSLLPGVDQDGSASGQQEYLDRAPETPPYDLSFGFMKRTHWLRRFCRFILSSDKVEERERARAASLRKAAIAASPSVRSDSGSFWSRPPFDWLILFTIIASTVVLAIDVPAFRLSNPKSANIFQLANDVFTIIFIAEFVLRVFADGVWFTPRAYFKNPWNLFDFGILIVQVIDVFYFSGSKSSQVRLRALIQCGICCRLD